MKLKDRELIHSKYSGRCAYRGKEIELKDMQVDHIQAERNGGTDSIGGINEKI